MGEQELFEFHADTYPVHNIGWSREKAAVIIRDWQRAFEKKLQEVAQEKKQEKSATAHEFLVFSSSHLSELMKQYTVISPLRLIIAAVVMVRECF